MNRSTAPSAPERIRIGDLLIREKILSEEALKTALAAQRKSGHKLGRVLIELGYVNEETLLAFLSRQLQIPLIDLKHYRFHPETVRLLPESYARRHRALVLQDQPDGLLVGLADPTDIFAYDELSRLLKKPLRLALVQESDLLRAIDVVYRRTEEISSLAEEIGAEFRGEGSNFDFDALDQGEMLGEQPVVRLLKSLFEDAIQARTSDIHLEPEEDQLRVRQRIDGVLHEQMVEGRRVSQAIITRLKLMAGLDISEKRLPQDGRFSLKVKNRLTDVRLATLPTPYGETVVLRLLDSAHNLLKLEDLGLPPDLMPRVRKLIGRPTGMLLVTGPTGGGKSTTLYSILNAINKPEVKIITVEDPVEYRLPRISQVQVNPRINLDFARILRTALRQDPDIIMVGEIRDEETMDAALRAALMGHLVLSTLHTNDAPTSLDRLLNMGAPGYLIAATVNGVISQRLIRRLCEDCVESHPPDSHETAWLEAQNVSPHSNWRHGRGCPFCNMSGFHGRIGIFELLEMDAPLARALRLGDPDAVTRAAQQQTGYVNLVRRALGYAETGITSLSEVIRIFGEIDPLRGLG
jgi:MSHA biogenesis protein MshE